MKNLSHKYSQMYDVFFITKNDFQTPQYQKLLSKVPHVKIASDLSSAKNKSLTSMFWVVWDDVIVSDEFNFDFTPTDTNTAYVFLNRNYYDGIALINKNATISPREEKHRFFINRVEVPVVASYPIPYPKFTIENYQNYLTAFDASKTDMFWLIFNDVDLDHSAMDSCYISHHDSYARKQNHVFINKDDKLPNTGMYLVSKFNKVSEIDIELKQITDVEISESNWFDNGKYEIFNIDSYEEYLYALENSKTEMFWGTSRNIDTSNFNFGLYFTYDNDYDRHENHAFIHKVMDEISYNGVFLFSKNKILTKEEIENRFPVNRKEWPIVASGPVKYDIFNIDSYEEYLNALANSKTEMFWGTSKNIDTSNFDFDVYFNHNMVYDRTHNHSFVHKVDSTEYHNGLFLFSKHCVVSKKEIENRFPVNRKEWPIVASGPVKYDIFNIDSYEEYLNALANSKTEMFWGTSKNIDTSNFDFDVYFTHDNDYDRSLNHAFAHKVNDAEFYDGLFLFSKKCIVSKKEIEHRHLAKQKEWYIVASVPKKYDVVFISYQEPNADKNYEKLLEKVPNATRIHGIKGIHRAHVEAAKLCSTNMFWVVDGDAEIVDEFNFDYRVSRWDQDTVHVWRSINPVNGLIYGYGGVKLLPRMLTLNMNITNTDMTTSISNKFKPIHAISNVTAFNTDPFNAWKSAFRECVKLSSDVIHRNNTEENLSRLNTWTTKGADKPYGDYALMGAIAGSEYGSIHKNDPDAIAKINDFEWLREKFNANS